MDYPVMSYAGFEIWPKRDFGPSGYWIDGKTVTSGFVVCPEGQRIVNAMPGATWFQTVEDAEQGIDVFLAAGQDAQRFWHLMRAINRPQDKHKQPAQVPEV